jgi:biopolymer transport protein ExbD
MKKFDQINVIPFIDIMLVALAIVLTTATFISQGVIDINLPPAQHADNPSAEHTIEISLNAQGQFYYQQQAVSLVQLEQRLKILAKTTPLLLKIDKKAAFGQFTPLLDSLRHLQFSHVEIATEQP